jgi:hypothetical protein
LRDPVDGQVTMLECAYDQVEAQILAQMAQHSDDSSNSSSNTASRDEDSPLAAAAAQLRSTSNSSSIDDLVASVLRSGGSSGATSSSGSNLSLQEALAGSDLDPMGWLERFKGLNEAEALQELAVLKHMGQAGVLRPKASSGFNYGGGSVMAASGSSKKSKKRATRANAKRG